MAENNSFPWDGTTLGDAAGVAEYSSSEFGLYYSKAITSDGQGFVLPSYGNNLRVQATSPAAASVDVDTGAAYIKGKNYENTALLTLAISANASGSPRLDRVVLQINFTAQTIRAVVLTGTPAATPALPALTQIYGTTWEIPLAYIYVATGFATIGNTEIHDERVFAPTFQGLMDSDLSGHNLVFNSEFMGYSDLQAAPPTRPPEGWAIFTAIPTVVSATKPTAQPRGRALQMTAGGANRGFEQTFNVPPSKTIAIRLLMNVTAGDVGEIVVTTNSASPNTITRTMRRTGSFLEETIYYITEADATTMTIREYCVNNTDVVQIGQTLAVVGYWPGRFREIHEQIMFVHGLTDANWFSTAKSDGNTVITLTSDFGGFILLGTRAACLRLGGRDSGSAANDPFFGATPIDPGVNPSVGPILSVGGLANDRIGATQGWIRLNSLAQFNFNVDASGVGTLDATAYVSGIET